MAFIDLLQSRRSVRSFLDKPVEREKIIKCLEAARLAPSACNSQPWKFVVVDDKKLLEKLCGAAFRGTYAINSFCRTAPVMVAIVSEKSRFWARVGGLLRDIKYYLLDIGIAGEHLVLQAEELGLGSCWIGWFDEAVVKSLLGVPKDKRIDVMIALGYYDPAVVSGEHDREPLESIASFNSYSARQAVDSPPAGD
jgi:nitroreductase